MSADQTAVDVTAAVLGVMRRWKGEGAFYTGDIARGVRQPTARVRRVLEDLEQRGRVRRVVIGTRPFGRSSMVERHDERPAPGDGGTTYIGPVVCWICGYSAERRRGEVVPGGCDVAAEWGRPRERCLMNSPEEQAHRAFDPNAIAQRSVPQSETPEGVSRGRGGHADAG